MFAAKAGQRFSLLLLEEGEAFVRDYVATADWPECVSGVALGRLRLPGQLRLATKSLFFEPDDLRVPIVRWEREGRVSVGENESVCAGSRHQAEQGCPILPPTSCSPTQAPHPPLSSPQAAFCSRARHGVPRGPCV